MALVTSQLFPRFHSFANSPRFHGPLSCLLAVKGPLQLKRVGRQMTNRVSSRTRSTAREIEKSPAFNPSQRALRDRNVAAVCDAALRNGINDLNVTVVRSPRVQRECAATILGRSPTQTPRRRVCRGRVLRVCKLVVPSHDRRRSPLLSTADFLMDPLLRVSGTVTVWRFTGRQSCSDMIHRASPP